jgi:hypothetical protein
MLALAVPLAAQQPAASHEPPGPSAVTGSFSTIGAHYPHLLVQPKEARVLTMC